MIQIEKLHAACDECRMRKLKCSGEKPKCTRCNREKIECVFSPRKQMGRPRKRRRGIEENENTMSPTEIDFGATDARHLSEVSDPNFLTLPQYDNPNFHVDSLDLQDRAVTQSLDEFHTTPLPEIDFELPIDPSLWDNPAIIAPPPEDVTTRFALAPCTCLSLMYLTLTELQSIPSFAFPQVIVPLRKAMDVLSDLINCPQCPKDNFSAIQNISSIVALCKAIVERFSKVLIEIDAEAERLEQNGQKKPYRIGDSNPDLQHLHTGTLDCPMGFNIEIEPGDWKRLAKTALKAELYGKGSNPRPLLQLVTDAEERQKRWHEDKWHQCVKNRHLFGGRHPSDAKKSCEALGADHIRRVVSNLKWE
ncbi:hypothetical protein CC86DRAFT_278989 [Ophiobolus disseminans]|uniref:Zn(2)-C6 fungal-type domain-containing protein n=1 Tax=Ophiobolus disseminans TaxID=1469910 RepID=A0A6A7AKI4_9PLEO|nr:hypothetical protein CC86DRAFT_278989 [Ophiobolus disseminans]